MTKRVLLPGLGGGSYMRQPTVGPRINFEAPDMPNTNAAAAVSAEAALAQAAAYARNADVEVMQANANGGISGGSIADRLLASNFNVNALRTNATLRRDEWILFDNTVMEVTRQRMVGVQDLVSRGLTTDIPNALGHTRIEWQRMGELTGAEISMSGISRAENDRLEFDLVGMPLPIIYKDFNMNIRHLAASRNGGMPLDTLQIAAATRVVVERIEQILFLGTTALGSNNPIHGYLSTPNRITGSVTAGWATATGAQIVGDILAIIQAAANLNMFGPFVFYVPVNAFTMLGRDYATGYPGTILSRIREIPGVLEVKSSVWLTGNNVVAVMMTREVVDLLDGIQPTVIEWESHGGMVKHFKVMAIMVPRIRADMNGAKGIVHYS